MKFLCFFRLDMVVLKEFYKNLKFTVRFDIFPITSLTCDIGGHLIGSTLIYQKGKYVVISLNGVFRCLVTSVVLQIPKLLHVDRKANTKNNFKSLLYEMES